MTDYRQLTEQLASQYDLPFFAAQINQESGYNPHARSGAGALGIAQIMPATARSWGVDPMDPVAALTSAAKHMAGYVKAYHGNYADALAAYNAGPGNVHRWQSIPETRNYVHTILGASGHLHAPAHRGTILPAAPAPLELPAGDPTAEAILARDTGVSPLVLSLLGSDATAAAPPTTHRAAAVAPSSRAAAYDGPVAHGWQDLQRIAHNRFGLVNDPGTSQTIGGHHTVGSEHYKGRAIDFGNARNTQHQLNAWMSWARAHGYDAINEGDHIHVSLPGGGI